MAQNEPPHQDLRCLQIQLYASLVVKELRSISHIVAEFLPLEVSAIGQEKKDVYVMWSIKEYLA